MNIVRIIPVAIVLLMAALPTHAAVYRVGSGAGCTHATIQAAIDAAKISSGSDEIRISRSQTYAQQALTISQVPESLTLAGGYAQCADESPTPGARTTIDGSNSTLPVLQILGTRTVILANLDITDGRSSGYGGGIYASGTLNTVLLLSNTLVRGNQALLGGGIAIKNSDPQGNPEGMQLLLFGNSAVSSNTAMDGGGIHCTNAKVMLFDAAHLSLNNASANGGGHGGGLYADNCKLDIGSRGINGAVIWSNHANFGGGGIDLRGEGSRAQMYTIDAFTPARITGNSAGVGGGIAISRGAQLSLFDTNIENNTAENGGAGVLIQSDAGATADTRFFMVNARYGAPPAAVACLDAEACNRVSGNQARSDSVRKAGAAVLLVAGEPHTAHASFVGTRIDSNIGESLTRHAGAYGQIAFNGAVLVNNDASGTLLDAPGTANSLVVIASTLATNQIGLGRGVIVGAGNCNPEDDARGTIVNLSIIDADGHPLIEPSTDYASGCFRYLIGNDFAGLPPSPERVVADPQFSNSAGLDYRLALGSPAVDFASATPQTATRDAGPRVFDTAFRTNLFGAQDLGAYEMFVDTIFSSGFEAGFSD